MLGFVRTAIWAGIAVVASALTPALAQEADPLAPARQGQMQCYEPNAARKACQSIGAFRFETNGAIQNVADVLIMPEPVVVMRIVSPVTVRNGAICGPLTTDDLNRAHFTVDGQRASEADAQAIRGQLAEQLEPLLNVESCISLTPVDGGFRADTALNGMPQPQLSQRLIWIRPEDGYTIAP